VFLGLQQSSTKPSKHSKHRSDCDVIDGPAPPHGANDLRQGASITCFGLVHCHDPKAVGHAGYAGKQNRKDDDDNGQVAVRAANPRLDKGIDPVTDSFHTCGSSRGA